DVSHPGHVERIDRVAGGEQRAGGATRGVGEVDQDPRARSRYAWHAIGAQADGFAVAHGHLDRQQAFEVGVPGADPGHAFGRRYEAGLDRVLADGGGDVAAQAVIVDVRLVDLDLTEGVGDVGVEHPRPTDDGELAGERIGAAQ